MDRGTDDKMKAYVSGKFEDYEKASAYMRSLESLGFQIAYDWTTEEARTQQIGRASCRERV